MARRNARVFSRLNGPYASLPVAAFIVVESPPATRCAPHDRDADAAARRLFPAERDHPGRDSPCRRAIAPARAMPMRRCLPSTGGESPLHRTDQAGRGVAAPPTSTSRPRSPASFRPMPKSKFAGAALLPIVDLTPPRPARASQGGGGGVVGANGVVAGGGGSSERVASAPRSTPATRSISGARTARRCAPPRSHAIASRFDREVIVLSTVATVINTYFQVLAAQDRLRIARENVAAATRILKVYQERIGVGTATGLDIAQQECAGRPAARRDPAARSATCARTSRRSRCCSASRRRA